METRVKVTASTKFDFVEIAKARDEARATTKTSGKTKSGIRFKKLSQLLILF